MRSEPLVVVALLATACSGGIQAEQIETRVSATMGTVVEVTWTTEEPTTGFVRFGVEGDRSRATRLETEPTTQHSALLVGLPADQPIELVVVTGEREVESKVVTVTTGALDGYAPTLDVQGDPGHFTVVPVLTTGGSRLAHPVILDPQGRVVWTYTDDREAQVYRAQLSRDGSGVTYSATVVGGSPVRDSALVRVGWEGEVLVTHEVPFLAHDFVELDDGTLVTLASECRDADGEPVELDDGGCPGAVEGNSLLSVSPDGTVETLWTTWDCLDPELQPSNAPDRDNWTHANALDHDAASGTFLVGMRNLDTIVAVDVGTRTCAWGLGGVGSTLDLQGSRFRKQHQFEWLDDTLLVFDNQGGFPDSRVVEYRFDPTRGAELLRELVSDPPVYTRVLGDVHRTSDGSTHVFWGNAGLVELFGADGASRSQIRFEDVILGFGQIATDPGRPDLAAP